LRVVGWVLKTSLILDVLPHKLKFLDNFKNKYKYFEKKLLNCNSEKYEMNVGIVERDSKFFDSFSVKKNLSKLKELI
jgi:hypothetical protein